LVPTFFLAPVQATFGTIAAILLASFGCCHWFALRDLCRGLGPLSADRPDVGDALRQAVFASHGFAACSLPLSLLPFLPCLFGQSAAMPAGYRFAALGILLPFLAWVMITSRRLGLEIADACFVRSEFPHERSRTLLVSFLAPATAATWTGIAISFLLPSPVDEHAFAILIWLGLGLGLPMLWAVWLQMELFAGIGGAVPASATFSEAARRVERDTTASQRVRSTPRVEELPPIEIADDLSPIEIIEDLPRQGPKGQQGTS
jgi:hypothetical protein